MIYIGPTHQVFYSQSLPLMISGNKLLLFQPVTVLGSMAYDLSISKLMSLLADDVEFELLVDLIQLLNLFKPESVLAYIRSLFFRAKLFGLTRSDGDHCSIVVGGYNKSASVLSF